MIIVSQNKMSAADLEHMVDYIECYIIRIVYDITHLCAHICLY